MNKLKDQFEFIKQNILNHVNDPHSKEIYKSVQIIFIDSISGGFIFYSGVICTQTFQYLIKISSSSRLIAPTIGFLSIMISSATAITLHTFPRKFYYHLKENNNEFKLDSLKSFRLLENNNKLKNNEIEYMSNACIGLILFKLLNGRFGSLAPSDYRNLGSFHNIKASLPATLDYADTNKRGMITILGKIYGCHTCGSKNRLFHADHMPPVNFAKKLNDKWYNKLLKKEITQRFYPQCEKCSNQQGILVQKNIKKLKTHFTSIRSYHFTGFWLIILFSGIFNHSNEIMDRRKPYDKTEANLMHALTNKAFNTVNGPLYNMLKARENYLIALRKEEYNKKKIKDIDNELKLIKETIKKISSWK